jgi:hypothetical protein
VSPACVLYVDDETVADVVGAARGVLILAKDDCNNCAAYEAEIRGLQDQGLLGDLVIGKIVLTRPGARGFKRANPWLSGVDVLPYTLLYASGEQVDEFAASKGTYLLERAADAGFI